MRQEEYSNSKGNCYEYSLSQVFRCFGNISSLQPSEAGEGSEQTYNATLLSPAEAVEVSSFLQLLPHMPGLSLLCWTDVSALWLVCRQRTWEFPAVTVPRNTPTSSLGPVLNHG